MSSVNRKNKGDNMEKATQENNVIDIKIQSANRLAEINALRKELEKEEKQLKDMFKATLAVGEVFETEIATILVSEKSRESLDRKSLEVEFGADIIGKYVKKTQFLQIDVKKKK